MKPVTRWRAAIRLKAAVVGLSVFHARSAVPLNRPRLSARVVEDMAWLPTDAVTLATARNVETQAQLGLLIALTVQGSGP
jgi:hypothetical protein